MSLTPAAIVCHFFLQILLPRGKGDDAICSLACVGINWVAIPMPACFPDPLGPPRHPHYPPRWLPASLLLNADCYTPFILGNPLSPAISLVGIIMGIIKL